MTPKIFIDGEAGTTGLEIFNRLGARRDIELIRLPNEKRKDPAARWGALNAADVAVLCLPDDAAVEAVAMVENPRTKVLDASTAHRTKPDWVYGFAELRAGHAEKIAAAQFVANPGCYATGAIALLCPLIESGILPRDFAAVLPSVSGYTGGGKSLIAAFEGAEGPDRLTTGFYEYGLNLEHKHLPEIVAHTGLLRMPFFIPSVGRFPRGMLVNLPLDLGALGIDADGERLQATFEAHYSRGGQVRVQPLRRLGKSDGAKRLEADALADTDWLDIHLFANDRTRQVLAVAALDNLGKGACGAAIQNLELMLGLGAARQADAAE